MPEPNKEEKIEAKVLDKTTFEIRQLQKKIKRLETAFYEQDEFLKSFVSKISITSSPVGGHIHPIISVGWWHGRVVSAPDAQSVRVCTWDSVLVTVTRPVFGQLPTPVANADVEFTLSNSTVPVPPGPGGGGPSISANPNGRPATRTGGSITTTTNANGEAIIYIHSTGPGTVNLEADTLLALGKDITITFL